MTLCTAALNGGQFWSNAQRTRPFALWCGPARRSCPNFFEGMQSMKLSKPHYLKNSPSLPISWEISMLFGSLLSHFPSLMTFSSSQKLLLGGTGLRCVPLKLSLPMNFSPPSREIEQEETLRWMAQSPMKSADRLTSSVKNTTGAILFLLRESWPLSAPVGSFWDSNCFCLANRQMILSVSCKHDLKIVSFSSFFLSSLFEKEKKKKKKKKPPTP